MTVKIIRVFFVLACVVMGVLWPWYIMHVLLNYAPKPSTFYAWIFIGGITGCAVSLLVLFLLSYITQDLYERLAPAFFAIVLSMAVGYLLARYILVFWQPTDLTLSIFLLSSLVLVFGFVGIMLGLTRASNWETLVRAVHKRHYTELNPKIVDTSVIIDGRIADICSTGFVDGPLLIPRFVLRELHNIADSADDLRRARGRRGLDILRVLQDEKSSVQVEVIEDDPTDVSDVDGKLVRVARDHTAKIVTNDLNLNKVAQIEGVKVLNINDLANALKPAVLPDEQMRLKIVKEGKEALQGVGFLDDGTMVVVDGGRNHVGKDVSVVVTSVLQTSAGRMIFTRLQEILS